MQTCLSALFSLGVREEAISLALRSLNRATAAKLRPVIHKLLPPPTPLPQEGQADSTPPPTASTPPASRFKPREQTRLHSKAGWHLEGVGCRGRGWACGMIMGRGEGVGGLRRGNGGNIVR